MLNCLTVLFLCENWMIQKTFILFYAIIMNIKVLLHCICICSGAGTRVTNYVPSKPFSMVFHHVVTKRAGVTKHQIWHESDKARQGEKKVQQHMSWVIQWPIEHSLASVRQIPTKNSKLRWQSIHLQIYIYNFIFSLSLRKRKRKQEAYWAIQRSWFARVNALCNLSRKKSQRTSGPITE